jgi:hypothetical protein
MQPNSPEAGDTLLPALNKNQQPSNATKLARGWRHLNKEAPQKCEASMWEHTGSNRGPSACKADALNQLSYAPYKWRAKIRVDWYLPKKIFL